MSNTIKQPTEEQLELFHQAYKDLDWAFRSLQNLEEEFDRVWFLRVQIQNCIAILSEMTEDEELGFWKSPRVGGSDD